MFEPDNLIDIFIDNIKKLFFPEEWFNIDLKFSKTEVFALLLLDKRKEVTMTELVEYINSPMSTATGIADRLVKAGYVSRERSETDRRIVILTLTEPGSLFVKGFKDTINGYIKAVLDDITPEEKQTLIQVAFKIIDKLQTIAKIQNSGEQTEKQIKKIEID